MRFTFFLTVVLMTISCSPSMAEEWPNARPRDYASLEGTFAFKAYPTIPASSKEVGVLFSFGMKAKGKVIWRKNLVNSPVCVYVANNGKFVVTTDTRGQARNDHALVIYGKQGQTIADFKLEDLLPPTELNANINLNSPRRISRRLTTHARFSFDGGHDPQHFIINFRCGKTVIIELGTGRVK